MGHLTCLTKEQSKKLTNFGSIVAPTDRQSLLKSNFDVNLQTSFDIIITWNSRVLLKLP